VIIIQGAGQYELQCDIKITENNGQNYSVERLKFENTLI